MKVKLLNDGGYAMSLSHIEFPVIVNAELYIDDLITVRDKELKSVSSDGHFLFYPWEYEVI